MLIYIINRLLLRTVVPTLNKVPSYRMSRRVNVSVLYAYAYIIDTQNKCRTLDVKIGPHSTRPVAALQRYTVYKHTNKTSR